MYSPTCLKQAPKEITETCLLKTGACLTQVNLFLFVMIGNRNTDLLIQVACLIKVATKTGLTVILKNNAVECHLNQLPT